MELGLRPVRLTPTARARLRISAAAAFFSRSASTAPPARLAKPRRGACGAAVAHRAHPIEVRAKRRMAVGRPVPSVPRRRVRKVAHVGKVAVERRAEPEGAAAARVADKDRRPARTLGNMQHAVAPPIRAL
eukprot:922263-Prymnesium_polylepis.1